MNEFIINLLDLCTYIAAILIVFLGCATMFALLLWAIWKVMDFIYMRTMHLTYFVQYVRHKKAFKEWYSQTEPNVYKPTLKGKK